MEENLRNKLWQVAERYLGDDPMHGLPHIRRGYFNFDLFLRTDIDEVISPAAMDAMETVIILHDIGRSVAGQSDHAAKGAEELGKLFKNELSEVENQGWIINAVAKHSIGLEKGRIENDGDIVLAFLCVFDHMDCLGPIGIHRLTLYWCGGQPYKIPWIPEKLTVLEKISLKGNLEYFLDNPWLITRKLMPMREHSFLECLVFFHGTTFQILKPVANILPNRLSAEIDYRLEQTKECALNLIQQFLV